MPAKRVDGEPQRFHQPMYEPFLAPRPANETGPIWRKYGEWSALLQLLSPRSGPDGRGTIVLGSADAQQPPWTWSRKRWQICINHGGTPPASDDTLKQCMS